MNNIPTSPSKPPREPYVCSPRSVSAQAAPEISPPPPTQHALGVEVGVEMLGSAGNGRVEEGPGLAGCKLQPVGARRIGDVAASVRNPGHGRFGAAVRGLHMALLPSRWLRRGFGGTAVGLNPLIAKLAAHIDAQDVVG